MQNELSYELIKEHLKRKAEYDGTIAYERLLDLEKRGIKLTPMQANLMFFKRGYGKTFMSYCNIIAENANKEYFRVNIKTTELDEESQACGYQQKVEWIRGFGYFMEQYGTDFKIRSQKQNEINYEKIR